MWHQLTQIVSNGVTGTIIGVVGLVVAIIFYLKSRQRAILAYQQRGLRLLGHNQTELPSDVSVAFKGRSIPRLSKTNIMLWNAGEKTIYGSDIVNTDPIIIEIPDGAEILSLEVKKVSREVTNIKSVLSNPNKIQVSFDFLDRNDGCHIEILHTAEERYVKVKGTVRGIPSGIKNNGITGSYTFQYFNLPPRYKNKRIDSAFIPVTTIFGICVLFYSLFFVQPIKFGFVFLGIFYLIPCLYFIISKGKRYPKILSSESND